MSNLISSKSRVYWWATTLRVDGRKRKGNGLVLHRRARGEPITSSVVHGLPELLALGVPYRRALEIAVEHNLI